MCTNIFRYIHSFSLRAPPSGMISSQTAVWPSLKAKAAETSCFAQPLVRVWQRYSDGERHDRMIEKLLDRIIVLEDTIQRNQGVRRFSTPEADSFEKTGIEVVGMLTWLANHHHADGRFLFAFTYKTHELLHAVAQARWINPSASWCYSGESLMNEVKRLIARSTHGRTKVTCVARAMERYWRGMSFGLSGR
jgi:hypothetical protein